MHRYLGLLRSEASENHTAGADDVRRCGALPREQGVGLVTQDLGVPLEAHVARPAHDPVRALAVEDVDALDMTKEARQVPRSRQKRYTSLTGRAMMMLSRT